jgi:type IV pilus assembly protein PilC
MNPRNGKISSEEFLRFNEQMLGLVRARVPLDAGLRQMAEEMERGRLKTFASAVAQELGRGRQLGEALDKFRPQVSDYYIALVKAGEKGGSLAEILHHIVSETRRQIDHRRAVATALAYPTMIVLVAGAILLFICVFLIPQFKNIFHDLGAELPEPTSQLIAVVDFLRARFLSVATVLALLVFVSALFLAGRIGRPFRDALLINVPIVGRLVYNDIAITFTRCMGFLLTRGVPMTDALMLTRSVLRNVHAKQFVDQIRDGVVRGERFSDLLDRYPYFPLSTRWMIRMAEERGDLGQTFLDLADFYQSKQQHLRVNVQVMLEPVLIVGLGLVVGFIVVSLYLPLFTIPKVIK